MVRLLSRMSSTYRVFVVEFMKITRRKSAIIMLVVAFLPLVFAPVIDYIIGDVIDRFVEIAGEDVASKTWLGVLGAINSAPSSEIIIAGSIVSLGSYIWLFASILGASVFASDIVEGRLQYVLVRSVSRLDVVLAKVLTLLVFFFLVYVVAGVSAYVSMYIIVGRQAYVWVIPVYALSLCIATLPYLILSSILGLRFKKTVSAAVIAIVIYFVASIFGSIPMLFAVREAAEAGDPSSLVALSYKVTAITPFTGSLELFAPLVIDYIVVGGSSHIKAVGLPIPVNPEILPTIGELLSLTAISTLLTLTAVLVILVYYFNKYIV